MEMKTTKNLHEVIATALSVPVEAVSDSLEYQSIPEWDSMSHLVLVTELENAFKVSIETQDVLEMGSVASVREILKKYGAEVD